MKAIKRILPATRPHWVGTGFYVNTVFGKATFTNEISPFLLFDYSPPKQFDPTTLKLGVNQHPHRGFETVTIPFSGEVEHRDSAGHHGIVGAGDVQWMTAASGIIHEEHHSKKFAEEGGIFEVAQLWVNLPAKDKMTTPRYQAILKDEIPVVQLENEAGEVRVIAGEYDETPGPACTFSPINVWDMRITAGKTVNASIPAGHNTVLFVRAGSIEVAGGEGGETGTIGTAQAAVLTVEGTSVNLKNVTTADATVLVLGGEPLNEPIAAKGLFVMNTEEELLQAKLDYEEGRFGNQSSG